MNTGRRLLLKSVAAFAVMPTANLVSAATRVLGPSHKFSVEVERLTNHVQREFDEWLKSDIMHVARVRALYGVDLRDHPTAIGVDSIAGHIKIRYRWVHKWEIVFSHTGPTTWTPSDKRSTCHHEVDLPTRNWETAKAVGRLLKERTGAENFAARRIDPVCRIGFAGDNNA